MADFPESSVCACKIYITVCWPVFCFFGLRTHSARDASGPTHVGAAWSLSRPGSGPVRSRVGRSDTCDVVELVAG